MKNIKIKDLIPPSKYDKNTRFIIVFIKENKSEKLGF